MLRLHIITHYGYCSLKLTASQCFCSTFRPISREAVWGAALEKVARRSRNSTDNELSAFLNTEPVRQPRRTSRWTLITRGPTHAELRLVQVTCSQSCSGATNKNPGNTANSLQVVTRYIPLLRHYINNDILRTCERTNLTFLPFRGQTIYNMSRNFGAS